MNSTTCKAKDCGEQIVWFETAAGKKMPVDASSVEVGDTALDLERHVSHFATCCQSNQFRRKPVSKVNFENAPPTGAGATEGSKRTTTRKKQDAASPAIQTGDLIRCLETKAFGMVVSIVEDPNTKLLVEWADGKRILLLPTEAEKAEPSSYYETIRDFVAEAFGVTDAELQAALDDLAGERERMSFGVLSELETKFLEHTSVEAPDADYESCWETIEETAQKKEEAPEGDVDIFSQFGEEGEEETASPFDLAVALAETLEVPTEAPKEDTQEQETSTAADAADQETASATPSPEDPKSQGATTTAPATDAAAPAATTTDAAPAGDASASQSVPSSSRVYGVDYGLQKLENGDWIDLATGEILSRDWRLKRLGWSDLPVAPKLPENATKEQKAAFKLEVEAFEHKCDQVLDIILGIEDKLTRWNNAHADRCKPEKAEIQMWSEFLTPIAKELGKVSLKGKAQTMKLPSGRISFTKAGGWGFGDYELAKQELTNKVAEARKTALRNVAQSWGVSDDEVEQFVSDTLMAFYTVPDQFKGIVEPTVSVDYPKFSALAKKGALETEVEVEPGKVELKPFPGTKKAPEDRFAKVAFKSPKDSGSESEGETDG